MRKLIREIESLVKELLSIIHWASTITLIAGLMSFVGSFEETVNFMIRELMIPSIVTNVLTGILMEILETRFPSIYRLLRRVLS